MDRLILEDELSEVTGFYKTLVGAYMHPPKFVGISKKGRYLFENAVVVSDSNPLGKLMFPAMQSIKNKGLISSVKGYSVYDGITKFEDFEYEADSLAHVESIDSAPVVNKCTFTLCLDCEKTETRDAWLDAIKKVTEYASKGKDNKCTIVAILPEYPEIPDEEINSLSEREFGYFMEKCLENPTDAQKYYVEVETLCRKIVNDGFDNLNIIRVDNLFGPDSNQIRYFDIEKCVKDAFQSGVMNITTKDYENVISVSYIRDAICFAIQTSYCGRKGQVYNFCSHLTTIANIKNTIRNNFKEQLSLNAQSSSVGKTSYRCLNTLKFFQAGWKKTKHVSLSDALYRTVCNITGEKDNNKNNIAIYSGKLTRIKDLELMMLKDIDDICNANDIKYFLCGGTMLGAVRYGHSIPWDDDLDIGMLRKDFDKFRQAALKQNKDIYNYSSHWNKSGSHYIVDKIRLNGTYFSTRYSSIHEYPDGLFIDVLVYDQTSNNKFIGMLHSRTVHVLSKIIEVRWYNRPRRNPNFRKEMVLLPFIRILPLNAWHKIYEFVLTLFKNKKNAKYVIDSTGKLQKKGPFSIEGLEDVQRVDFDGGFQAPIPEDYTNYLTFDYGPGYLPEPPLTKRAAPHNFARIDLGEYIFETRTTPEFREVNVHGELFEKEV